MDSQKKGEGAAMKIQVGEILRHKTTEATKTGNMHKLCKDGFPEKTLKKLFCLNCPFREQCKLMAEKSKKRD